jgi:hypothetical protein
MELQQPPQLPFFFISSVVHIYHCFSIHRVSAAHSLTPNSRIKRNHATVRVSQIEINTNISKLMLGRKRSPCHALASLLSLPLLRCRPIRGRIKLCFRVRCTKGTREILCCPEDVQQSTKCNHGDDFVCEQCWIPFCTTCWHSLRRDLKIPKALANDNFIGYVAKFFVEHKVTWLEATIAAPVFSGLLHAISWKPFYLVPLFF